MSPVYRTLYKLQVKGGTLSVEMGLSENQWRIMRQTLDLHFDGDYKLRYFNDAVGLQMNDLGELVNKSRELGIDVPAEIHANPRGWAELISCLMRLPSPLREKTSLTSGYYATFGVDPDLLPISVANGVLQWYGLDPQIQPDGAALYRFNCSIDILEVDVTKTDITI